MKTNAKAKAEKVYTHGGGEAELHVTLEQQLRRSVLCCMLNENEFYEDGVSVKDRIKTLIPKVEPVKVAKIASDARNKMHLRHVPLMIIREMARLPEHKKYVADLIDVVVQRPDELTELLAMYYKEGKQPLSAQVKKGLAKAYRRFNEYQLAKYNRDNVIKLKDVMFLTHPRPIAIGENTGEIVPAINKPKYKRGEVMRHNTGKGKVWKDLINNNLATPDTWEVGLSAAKSEEEKKAVFEKLLSEKKLGAMAILRNLRNMINFSVDPKLIEMGLTGAPMDKVLPFRFIAAAKHAPKFEALIETAMFRCLEGKAKLPGKTVVIVDVSGSMYGSQLSGKSEMNRADAACAVAMLCRELCDDVAIYATAGNDRSHVAATEFVPGRRGFALRDKIFGLCKPLGGGGIFLKQVMDYVFDKEGYVDRVICITDEQDCSSGSENAPRNAKLIGKHNYMINVASAKNGIGYKRWMHIDGFSEAILEYIAEYERETQ